MSTGAKQLIRRFGLAATCIGLAAGLIASANRWSAAHRSMNAAEAELAATRTHVARVVELRAQRQTVAEAKRPDQDVIARVNSVLRAADISESCFGGLQPERDAPLADGRYRKQSVRISLNNLTIAQLSSFLDHWRRAQPLWLPEQIDLAHSRDAADLQCYMCTIVFSATYIAGEDAS